MSRAAIAVTMVMAACRSSAPVGEDATPAVDAPPVMTVLATGQSMPDAIAVSGDSVVWADFGSTTANGSIDRCSTAGGCSAATTPLVSPVGTPLMIAADATNVYYNQVNAVVQCAIANCQPIVLASGLSIRGIAVNDSTVFWIDEGGSSQGGYVEACAIGGCGMKPTMLATTGTHPRAIAVDRSNVYWTEMGGEIRACPLAGCNGGPPAPLAIGEAGSVALAADGSDLYWVDEGTGTSGGSVRTCSIAACTPTSLAQSEGGPDALAVDADAVYWVDSASDEIRACSKSACAPRTLGTTHIPVAIALDATAVYVAGWGDGDIVKITK